MCSLRPLLVRKPSVLCAFFLWTNLKTSRKRNSKDSHPGTIRHICAFAKVKGCLVWNSATAVNLLRLPDIPSFTWWLCWRTKGKWRLQSAHNSTKRLMLNLENHLEFKQLFNIAFSGCVKMEGRLRSSLTEQVKVPVAAQHSTLQKLHYFIWFWLLSSHWAKPTGYHDKPDWCRIVGMWGNSAHVLTAKWGRT